MANDNFLSVTCYNVTMLTTNYYTDFFELGQQKINFSFYGYLRKYAWSTFC